MKSKLTLIRDIKLLLSEARHAIFRSTCFGSWLDLNDYSHDPLLVFTFLQMERVHDADESLYFTIGDHVRSFGPREFCLITGLVFGEEPAQPQPPRQPKSRGLISRLTPQKGKLTIRHVNDKFKQLDVDGNDGFTDQDAVRLCLILMVEMFFLGRQYHHPVSDIVRNTIEDIPAWNKYPWGTLVWQATFRQMHGSIQRRASIGSKLTFTTFLHAFKVS